MPGSHLAPPSNAPRGRALAPRGGVPRLPWWRRASDRALVGTQMDKECRCRGVQDGWGSWGSLSPCLPLLPLPGGLKVPQPGRREEGGHGHRQMRHSETNVTSTICCSV